MPLVAATCFVLMIVHLTPTSALKWNTLDTGTAGCHGSTYTARQTYGAQASRWGHLPRGGWRGAVLGPDGETIYGIPTNASTVSPACIAEVQGSSV